MSKTQFSNRFLAGFISGLLLPLLVFFIIYLFSNDDMSFRLYVNRIIGRNALASVVSLSVLANLIIFLLFNRFDKLKSSRGVLGITIIWALGVLAIKLFL